MNKRIKFIAPVLVTGIASAVVAGIVISNQQNHNKQSSQMVVNKAATTNASTTSSSSDAHPQYEYEQMSRIISSIPFNVGNPFFELAVRLNSKQGQTLQQTRAQVINKNVGAYKPKLLDDLYDWDNSHPNGWTLELAGNKWDDIDLNAIDIFGKFQNITSIAIEVKDSMEGVTSWDLSSLKNVQWFSSLNKLEKMEFMFIGKPQNVSSKIDLNDIKSFDNITSLKQLNFSGLVDSTGNSLINGKVSDSTLFGVKGLGFELWMPGTFNYVEADEIGDADITKENGIAKFTKKVFSAIGDPTDNDYSPITIDGKQIDAFLYNNNWYWLLDDVNLLGQVKYKNIINGKDFSTTPKTGFETISVRKNLYDPKYTKSFFEHNSTPPVLAQKLTTSNIDDLKETFKVDGVEHGYHLVDSNIVPDYDMSNIKFISEENGVRQYFTHLSKVSDTIRLINLSSLFPISGTQMSTKPVAIDEPVDKDDKLGFDSQKISSFLLNGTFRWNISGTPNIPNPIYYSHTLKRLFSDVDALKQLSTIPNDLNAVNMTDYAQKEKYVISENIENAYQITDQNAATLKDTINVNGHVIPKVLRNGAIYFDDSNVFNIGIQDVQYVRKDADPSKNLYFTTFDELTSKNQSLANCYQLVPKSAPLIPAPHLFKPPTFASFKRNDSTVSIEPLGHVSVILRDGELFWDTTALVDANKKQLDFTDIKYYDSISDRYFQKIPNANIPEKLTEVSTSGLDLSQKIAPKLHVDIFDNLFDITVGDSWKVLQWGNRAIVDGDEKKFIIYNSKIVWESSFALPKYIYDFKDQYAYDVTYLTDKEKINASMVPLTSEVQTEGYVESVLGTAVKESDLPIINDPEDEKDKVIFRYYNQGKSWKDEEITTVEVGGKLYWKNTHLLENAKYKLTTQSNKIIYCEQLDGDILTGVTRVDSIGKKNISKFISENDITYEYKPVENKKMIAVVASVTGAAIIAMPATLVWIKLLRKRKGK